MPLGRRAGSRDCWWSRPSLGSPAPSAPPTGTRAPPARRCSSATTGRSSPVRDDDDNNDDDHDDDDDDKNIERMQNDKKIGQGQKEPDQKLRRGGTLEDMLIILTAMLVTNTTNRKVHNSKQMSNDVCSTHQRLIAQLQVVVLTLRMRLDADVMHLQQHLLRVRRRRRLDQPATVQTMRVVLRVVG